MKKYTVSRNQRNMIAYLILSCHLLLIQQGIVFAANVLVSTLPCMTRISQTNPIAVNNNVTVYAARGEYESFQIAVRGDNTTLTNVNVLSSDLVSSSGDIIPKSNITLYREHYLYASSSPVYSGDLNPPLGNGWYPDGLIPFVDPQTGADLSGASLDAAPFSVSLGQNEVIWVDLYVPRGTTKPGDYQGTFTITSDQGTSTVDAILHVWDFELPLIPSLKTAFGISMGTYTQAQAVVYFEAMRELCKHKIYPERITGPGNDNYPSIAQQGELYEKYGMSQTILPYWMDASSTKPPPTLAALQTQLTRYYPKIEPLSYPLDEPGSSTSLYSNIIQWGARMHEAGVRQLITMPPVTGLFDDGRGTGQSAVDIWTILPFQYNNNKTLVDQALQKGDEIWSYNCLTQDRYSPKWEIDYPPINYRIMPGFINQSLDITGLLYWRTDYWSSDPWNNPNTGSFSHWPGEGMLVYPGSYVGIVGVAPSMRLKYLRDGVEDYDYIQILKNLGERTWALTQAATVGRDWQNWTRDPQVLQNVRVTLGEEIERLNSGGTFGDVSGDGKISAYDAALTAQAAVGLITLTTQQIQKADVDGNVGISAYDAALIAQKAVGLITKFPVEP